MQAGYSEIKVLASSCSQSISFAAINATGCRFFPPRSLEDLLQGEDFRFRYQHTRVAELLSFGFSPGPVMNDWHVLNVEFKTKACYVPARPMPHGLVSYASNDLHRLMNVVKTLAGLLIDVRRRIHPGRLPICFTKITKEIEVRLQMVMSYAPIYQGREKPVSAAPVINGCVSPDVAAPGEVNSSPFQSQADYLRECWPWDAPWCRMSNLQSWDNAGDFRSDSTGFFD